MPHDVTVAHTAPPLTDDCTSSMRLQSVLLRTRNSSLWLLSTLARAPRSCTSMPCQRHHRHEHRTSERAWRHCSISNDATRTSIFVLADASATRASWTRFSHSVVHDLTVSAACRALACTHTPTHTHGRTRAQAGPPWTTCGRRRCNNQSTRCRAHADVPSPPRRCPAARGRRRWPCRASTGRCSARPRTPSPRKPASQSGECDISAAALIAHCRHDTTRARAAERCTSVTTSPSCQTAP
jgi:hypothetical protein